MSATGTGTSTTATMPPLTMTDLNNANAIVAAQIQMYQQAMMNYSAYMQMIQSQHLHTHGNAFSVPRSLPLPQGAGVQTLLPHFGFINNCNSPTNLSNFQQTSLSWSPSSLSGSSRSNCGSVATGTGSSTSSVASHGDRLGSYASIRMAGMTGSKPSELGKKKSSMGKADQKEETEENTGVQAIDAIEMDSDEESVAEFEYLGEGTAPQAPGHADRTERHPRVPSHERERGREAPHVRELRLMRELRTKAVKLKKRIIKQFEMEKEMKRCWPRAERRKKIKQEVLSESKRRDGWKCVYPGCSFTANWRSHLAIHVAGHYPNVFFCPACLRTFPRLSVFDRHFQENQEFHVVPRLGTEGMRERRRERVVGQSRNESQVKIPGRGANPYPLRISAQSVRGRGKDLQAESESESEPSGIVSVSCIESEEALRYEVGRDKERFNVYYLGVMEDYEMSEAHFEILAGRRRGEVPVMDIED